MISLRTAKSATMLSRVVTRNFCRTATLRKEGDIAKSSAPQQAAPSGVESIRIGSRSHAPNNLEKRFLIWSGKFKTIDEIPPTVPEETIEKARNKARIRIANYMMAGTLVACICFVISGKRAASRGESVHKMNLDWHRQYNESQGKEASK